MKKLLIVLLLAVGATTFTSAKKAEVRETPYFWTCTVGDVVVDSRDSRDPCGDARREYCRIHTCRPDPVTVE